MQTVTIKIKKLNENAVVPEYKTSGAACFDLVATEIERSGQGNKYAKIKFGIACEIPEGYKIEIEPRSSNCLKGWIQGNSPGQVDSDYRGELMWFLEAIPYDIKNAVTLSYPELPYKVGERCAQAHIEEVIKGKFELVNELSETERGSGGFGSTGKV